MAVAIKALPIYSPQNRKDFEREASLMAKLNHENIVVFYGISYVDDSNELLVVLEHMDIGDLRTYLRQRSPVINSQSDPLLPQLCAEAKVDMAAQAAEGLQVCR